MCIGTVAGLDRPNLSYEDLGIPPMVANDTGVLDEAWGGLVEWLVDEEREERVNEYMPKEIVGFTDMRARFRGTLRPVGDVPGLPREPVDCLSVLERLVAENLNTLERVDCWQRFQSFAAILWLRSHGGSTPRGTVAAPEALRDGAIATMFGSYLNRANPQIARWHLQRTLEEMNFRWSEALTFGLDVACNTTPYEDYAALSQDVAVLLNARGIDQ